VGLCGRLLLLYINRTCSERNLSDDTILQWNSCARSFIIARNALYTSKLVQFCLMRRVGGHGSRRRLVAETGGGGRDRQSARVSGQDL